MFVNQDARATLAPSSSTTATSSTSMFYPHLSKVSTTSGVLKTKKKKKKTPPCSKKARPPSTMPRFSHKQHIVESSTQFLCSSLNSRTSCIDFSKMPRLMEMSTLYHGFQVAGGSRSTRRRDSSLRSWDSITQLPTVLLPSFAAFVGNCLFMASKWTETRFPANMDAIVIPSWYEASQICVQVWSGKR